MNLQNQTKQNCACTHTNTHVHPSTRAACTHAHTPVHPPTRACTQTQTHTHALTPHIFINYFLLNYEGIRTNKIQTFNPDKKIIIVQNGRQAALRLSKTEACSPTTNKYKPEMPYPQWLQDQNLSPPLSFAIQMTKKEARTYTLSIQSTAI